MKKIAAIHSCNKPAQGGYGVHLGMHKSTKLLHAAGPCPHGVEQGCALGARDHRSSPELLALERARLVISKKLGHALASNLEWVAHATGGTRDALKSCVK